MKPAKKGDGTLNALAISTPSRGLSTYCAAHPMDNGTGLDVARHKETNISASEGKNFFPPAQCLKKNLLKARAKSSTDSLMPIDSMMPPSAGA
jgi:hypothetical protein